MQIPLIDLVAQYKTIESEVAQASQEVMNSGRFVLGPNVGELEREVADYLGVKEAVGVASGTDALVLALRALEIGPGTEIIVPAYSFFASAEAVLQVGAVPVFVDIDPVTYCLNVQQVASKITGKTRAVIPVHLYGHPADMLPLIELANSHGLKVIEDNAQAFGAEYFGRKTGSIGDVGCLSFFPSKNLGAYGDGGMLVSNDSKLVECVRMLRTHGWQKKYFPEIVGYNSRLDELQAAILRVKLKHLDHWNERRSHLAHLYQSALSRHGFQTPKADPSAKHVYHLFVIRVRKRQQVQQLLRKAGIASAVYYPMPLHLVEPCSFLKYQVGSFPVAESACQETLALPLYPEMPEAYVEKIVAILADSRLVQ